MTQSYLQPDLNPPRGLEAPQRRFLNKSSLSSSAPLECQFQNHRLWSGWVSLSPDLVLDDKESGHPTTFSGECKYRRSLGCNYICRQGYFHSQWQKTQITVSVPNVKVVMLQSVGLSYYVWQSTSSRVPIGCCCHSQLWTSLTESNWATGGWMVGWSDGWVGGRMDGWLTRRGE